MPEAVFVEAPREIHRVTAGIEKQALVWMAERLPRMATPGHLTGLGLLSMLTGGIAYALTPRDLRWLHGVNLGLLLNRFGNSLADTVERVRRTTRPHHGFCVDHLVDAFGALSLFAGPALSNLIQRAVAVGLLVAYLLLSTAPLR